jgi:hypothetical protein
MCVTGRLVAMRTGRFTLNYWLSDPSCQKHDAHLRCLFSPFVLSFSSFFLVRPLFLCFFNFLSIFSSLFFILPLFLSSSRFIHFSLFLFPFLNTFWLSNNSEVMLWNLQFCIMQYNPTKSCGYPYDSADVSVWLISRMVVSLVPFLATQLFASVAI